jgi:hypothetical protein
MNLNVYHAYWVQSGHGLSAMIIAASKTEALTLLGLDEYCEKLKFIKKIGSADSCFRMSIVVIKESL